MHLAGGNPLLTVRARALSRSQQGDVQLAFKAESLVPMPWLGTKLRALADKEREWQNDGQEQDLDDPFF